MQRYVSQDTAQGSLVSRLPSTESGNEEAVTGEAAVSRPHKNFWTFSNFILGKNAALSLILKKNNKTTRATFPVPGFAFKKQTGLLLLPS